MGRREKLNKPISLLVFLYPYFFLSLILFHVHFIIIIIFPDLILHNAILQLLFSVFLFFYLPQAFVDNIMLCIHCE